MSNSNEYYNFQIKSNVKASKSCEIIDETGIIILKHEYYRSQQIVKLHSVFENKYRNAFSWMKYLPKDAFNRFLLEQLSNSFSSSDDTIKYDRFLSKPRNIKKLDTIAKEIRLSIPILNDLKYKSSLQDYKIINYIKLCITTANNLINKVDDKRKNEVNETLNAIKKIINEFDNKKSDEYVNKFNKLNRILYKNYTNVIDKIIEDISNELYAQIKEASLNISKNLEQLKICKIDLNEENVEIKFENENDLVIVRYKELSFNLIETYLKKLEMLYSLNNNNEQTENNEKFKRCLFALLSRYRSYFRNSNITNEGYGMQAALPSYVFQVLNQLFGVTQEAFASPFNCYFSRYCSAFPDVDCYFGSCGSFFDFKPVEGSFQCNPPFTEEVIERMADRIEYLLGNTELPLSFIVFVPHWIDPPTPGIIKMESSLYLKRDFVVKSSNHKYVTGSQHIETNKSNLYYDAAHDTKVFFLQNDAAHKIWEPSNEKINNLLKVMENKRENDLKRKLSRENNSNSNQINREDLRQKIEEKRKKLDGSK